MPKSTLSDRLATATENGTLADVRAFFNELCSASLIVPRRKQAHPMSDAPVYPNDLFDFLAVQHGERVLVPVFSDVAFVKEWCGAELETRELSFSSLAAALPSEWWLIFNPGQEYSKELSSWEISELQTGEPGLATVSQEALGVLSGAEVTLEPLSGSDAALQDKIKSALADLNCEALYVAKRVSRGLEQSFESLIVAFRSAKGADIKSEIQSRIAPFFIGGLAYEVLDLSSPVDGLRTAGIENFPPVIERKGSWLTKLFST